MGNYSSWDVTSDSFLPISFADVTSQIISSPGLCSFILLRIATNDSLYVQVRGVCAPASQDKLKLL